LANCFVGENYANFFSYIVNYEGIERLVIEIRKEKELDWNSFENSFALILRRTAQEMKNLQKIDLRERQFKEHNKTIIVNAGRSKGSNFKNFNISFCEFFR
jgi:hypothetical protein